MEYNNIITLDHSFAGGAQALLLDKITQSVGPLWGKEDKMDIYRAEPEELEQSLTISKLPMQYQQALKRFMEEEVRNQSNMEAITAHALSLLTPYAVPSQMDNDWMAYFFARARWVGSASLQRLWGKVLATEANAPGSLSRRTVNFISELGGQDVRLFTSLCRFGWLLEDFVPLVFDADDPIYRRHGITFKSLAHLTELGLITFDGMHSFSLNMYPGLYEANYHGQSLMLHLQGMDSVALDMGQVMLAPMGRELLALCDCKPVEGFMDYVREHWEAYLL